MIDCLRNRKVSDLTNVQLNVPDHLTAFGPIIDSIVVPFDPKLLYQLESFQRHQLARNQTTPLGNTNLEYNFGRAYDLMVGATDVDLPCIFTEDEVMSGVDPKRRDRILRTLVRNLYDFHQQVTHSMTSIKYVSSD